MPDCLLKPIKNKSNAFTAIEGKLTLNLTDIEGHTEINPLDTSVTDLTEANPTLSPISCATANSFTVDLESGKTYLISFTFIQLLGGANVRAELREACGELVGIITITGRYSGFIIEVA